jgi:hypothetical protein
MINREKVDYNKLIEACKFFISNDRDNYIKKILELNTDEFKAFPSFLFGYINPRVKP